ncbi:MAG: PaaI family thioesterase, partial [Pseudomonadota bacterium]
RSCGCQIVDISVDGCHSLFAAQAAIFAKLDGEKTVTTVNADIDYLTSARAQDMKARVQFTRIGRRLAFVEATGWQKEEIAPVATARFRMRLSDANDRV